MKKKDIKTVARNRKARYEYHIEDTVEAGIVLKGTEVKSIRQGKMNIQESYASVENGEVFVHGMHISPYEQGNIQNVNPIRKRKLLLNKREIRKLMVATTQKGYTLVLLSAYIRDGLVKIQLATARGKKLHDKRQDIAEKDAKRRMKQHSSEKYNA